MSCQLARIMTKKEGAITRTNPTVSEAPAQGGKAFEGFFLGIQMQQDLDKKLLTPVTMWHTFGDADNHLPESFEEPFFIRVRVQADELLQLNSSGFRRFLNACLRKRIKSFLERGDYLLSHIVEAVIFDGLEINFVGSHCAIEYRGVKIRYHTGSLPLVRRPCLCTDSFNSRLKQSK